MDKQTVDALCRKQMGSTHDYQVDWEADRYHIGGKMFAMLGADSKGVSILTLKCDPARADELREIYEGIVPGYHMNKTHWNSVAVDGLKRDLIFKLIDHSYDLVFKSLTKKVQSTINNS